MSEIPAEFADFVKAKRQQLATNILSSAAAGVVLANVAALFAGDASLAVLGETVQATVPLIVIRVPPNKANREIPGPCDPPPKGDPAHSKHSRRHHDVFEEGEREET